MSTQTQTVKVNTSYKKGLYVGSFDPVTLGHMDIIKRAANMFSVVTVAVGDNPSKKYMFNFVERVALLSKAINLLGVSNVLVETRPIKYLTADYARLYGYDVIVKGARTSQDFDYERLIHEVSATQQRDIETVLLFSSSHLSHVSSSATKEIAKFQGLIHKYVPIHVKAAIEAKLGQRIIGVTGTIGSGKSTFCKRMVSTFDCATHINMDLLSHELLTSNLPLAVDTREKIEKEFGTTDRKILGGKVFGNPGELKKLNEIFREPILTLLRDKLIGAQGTVLLEGALLVEMDWLFLCNNRVILVKTPSPEVHKRRLKARDLSDEQIERRLNSQYDYDEKMHVITTRLNADLYGKCVVFDSENENFGEAVQPALNLINKELS